MRRLLIALLVLVGADAVAVETPPPPASPHSIARRTDGRRARRHRRKRRHRRRRHRSHG